MDGKEVMDKFERGEAVGVYTTVLIVRIEGKHYISFDGEEWVETQSEFINKQLN